MADTRVATAARLNGVPQVNIAENLRVAFDNGRRLSTILREIVALRRAAGRLAPSEYFYYRLWDPHLSLDEKRSFVGKQAQHRMHVACNDRHWYQTAADKILFQTIMAGAALPVPRVTAITQAGRRLRGALTLDKPDAIAAFLRDPANFPLFAKPAAGKYSLNVISADAYDPASGELVLFGGARQPVLTTAQTMAGGAGYVIQPRLRPDAEIEAKFGSRLWSVRVLVFIRPNGPQIHRAVAKIAAGDNPADNYWRPGNMLGAVDLSSGRIRGVVRGTGAEMTRDETHPDTGLPVIGFGLPHWTTLCGLAREAATVFPGIRTQSWDIAVTDQGPVLLEVNFGGDLTLAQLAEGRGVLDDDYRGHLRQCGFNI